MYPTVYFIYDGSFEGLLTTLYYVLNDPKTIEINPYIIKKGSNISGELFAEYQNIDISISQADALSKSISKKLSSNTMTRIYYAFLSEIEESENTIYWYLQLALNKGKKIDEMFSHDSVQKFTKIVIKVSKERHRMLGFLRFKKLDFSVYYAPMEPEHDVITLIAPHFEKRFSDQYFIIHDVKRSKCALYNRDELIYTRDEIPEKK